MEDISGETARRALTLGIVVGLHVLVLGGLASSGLVHHRLMPSTPVKLIIERRKPPVLPSTLPAPRVAPMSFVPQPEFEVAAPVSRSERSRPAPAPLAAEARGHFASAVDTGLGLDVGTVAGGGAGDRGALATFEAAVRRQVLAGKRQPVLAWDRRATCIVSYMVSVDADGRLLSYSIDPCAVPEINDAARAAIQHAVYPRPPGSGSSDHEVHGTLVFRP